MFPLMVTAPPETKTRPNESGITCFFKIDLPGHCTACAFRGHVRLYLAWYVRTRRLQQLPALSSSATMSSFLGPGSSVKREDLTDEAFLGDLSELGWRGKYKFEDAEVVQFRVRAAGPTPGPLHLQPAN